MKFIFLDPVRLSNKDGCGIHKIELIKNLSLLDNSIYFFMKGVPDSSFEYLLKLPNVHVFHLGTNRLTSFIIYLWYLMIFSFYNKGFVLYSRNALYSTFGIMIAKLRNAPLAFEVNGIISDETFSFDSNGKKMSLKELFHFHFVQKLELLELFVLKHSSHVITVTPLLKKHLIEKNINHKKIHVIENGANTDIFTKISQSDARKSLNLSEGKNYVCFVGNLAYWQGIKYLIQAVPLVLKEKKVYFLIVGTGPLYEDLKKQAAKLGVADYFIFTGRVPYENVPLYINSSDVCVAPFVIARNERIGLSPLKIYEYMSCNKPVICSRIPNLEFIEEQNAGILFEPENVDDLAQSIISFFDEKHKYDNISSREYILKNNSWRGIAERIVVLVNSS